MKTLFLQLSFVPKELLKQCAQAVVLDYLVKVEKSDMEGLLRMKWCLSGNFSSFSNLKLQTLTRLANLISYRVNKKFTVHGSSRKTRSWYFIYRILSRLETWVFNWNVSLLLVIVLKVADTSNSNERQAEVSILVWFYIKNSAEDIFLKFQLQNHSTAVGGSRFFFILVHWQYKSTN